MKNAMKLVLLLNKLPKFLISTLKLFLTEVYKSEDQLNCNIIYSVYPSLYSYLMMLLILFPYGEYH